MKGITKIELFDANTGEKTDEIVEENMVTNALRNMLNPPLDFARGTDDCPIPRYLEAIYPTYSTLLGGVMVFSEKPEESADNIIPKVQVMESTVGYASQGEASAKSNLRGRFVEGESAVIPNGFKSVWEFAPSQANGTINSVCLTSKWGGLSGWVSKDTKLRKTIIALPPSNWRAEFLSITTNSRISDLDNGYDTNIGIDTVNLPLTGQTDFTEKIGVFFGVGVVCLVLANSSYNKILVRKKVFGAKQMFTDSFGNMDNSMWTKGVYQDKIFTLDSSFNSSYLRKSKDKGYAFMYPTAKNTMRVIEIKLDASNNVTLTDKVVTEQGVDLYTIRGVGSFELDDDFVYYGADYDKTEIYKFSRKTTGVAESIPLPTGEKWSNDSVITFMFGTLWFTTADRNSEGIYYLGTDNKTWYKLPPMDSTYNSLRFVHESASTFPWVIISNTKGDSQISLMFVTAYLGTINNLTAPVVKTSAKSMKITYTLTSE